LELLKANLTPASSPAGVHELPDDHFVIERYLYFARVDLGSFDHPDDLEVALTRHLTVMPASAPTLPMWGCSHRARF